MKNPFVLRKGAPPETSQFYLWKIKLLIGVFSCGFIIFAFRSASGVGSVHCTSVICVLQEKEKL